MKYCKQQSYGSRWRLLLPLAFVIALWPPMPAAAKGISNLPGCTQIALATQLEGSWDIVVLDTDRNEVRRLTHTQADERSPSWSPDGRMLAMSVHYNGNWDISIFDLRSGVSRRLTNSPAYDGNPAWSPDGQSIAFESNRDGNLDIYIIRIEDGILRQITYGSTPSIEPAWVNEDTLIVGSWISGQRQLYTINTTTGKRKALSQPGEEAAHPVISPAGQWVAYIRSVQGTTQVVVQDLIEERRFELSAATGSTWVTWARPSPESAYLVVLKPINSTSPDPINWKLQAVALPQDLNTALQPDAWSWPLTGIWAEAHCATTRVPYRAGQVIPAVTKEPLAPVAQGLAWLPDVRALQPRLASAVVPSFQRLRERIRMESGWDFLNTLNDAWRDIEHPQGKLLSWHKAGRAIDVRDWYAPDGQPALIIIREELLGQTFFQLYLRTARQDGSQGAPLRASIWDITGRMKRPDLRAQGGQYRPPPAGYFVNFTDLAAREGWTRNPARTPPDGDWRYHGIDLEFWHYERRDGMPWYDAMGMIYHTSRIMSHYHYDTLRARGFTVAELVHAGIPYPHPFRSRQK